MKKLKKQIRDQKYGIKIREWKQVKDGAQGFIICRTKINFKAFTIPILTAFGL